MIRMSFFCNKSHLTLLIFLEKEMGERGAREGRGQRERERESEKQGKHQFLFPLIDASLVVACVCPDHGSNSAPLQITTILHPTKLSGQHPLALH